MGPTKVFVGNLSFKTKEAELADEFRTAGKVVTANIITRGYRSLGYGFVEFETIEDAQNALNTLNKKSINGREINVELATPREEGAPRPPRQRRGSGIRGGRGGNSQRPEGGSVESPTNNGENRRGGYVGRGRGGYNRRGGSYSPSADAHNSPSNENEQGQPPQNRTPRGGRGYRRNGPRNNNPRSPTQNANRVPSTSTLFVANLPYALTDDELLNLLPKASKAYVAKNYNGRSKGFGFIEFAVEDDQKAALNAAEKLQALGRDLIVKIALTEAKKPAGSAPASPNLSQPTPQ